MQDQDRFAALGQRVADLEEVNAVALDGLRDKRAAADPEVQAAQAAADVRSKACSDALAILKLKLNGLNGLRFALGALRRVLDIARAVMESDATSVRNTLPPVITAIERVQALAAEAPEVAWPESVELLQEAEHMRDDATAALRDFDRRMEEQEQMRRRRLGLPEDSEAAR